MKSRNVGKTTDDDVKVPGFNVIFVMVVELSNVWHEEGITRSGGLDNKVEPLAGELEAFNDIKFKFSQVTSVYPSQKIKVIH